MVAVELTAAQNPGSKLPGATLAVWMLAASEVLSDATEARRSAAAAQYSGRFRQVIASVPRWARLSSKAATIIAHYDAAAPCYEIDIKWQTAGRSRPASRFEAFGRYTPHSR